jgi:hypothetical protein
MDCCARITIQIYRTGFWLYRKLFPVEYQHVPIKKSVSKLPWMFVGIELKDGTLLDRTEEANYLAKKDVVVTRDNIDISIDSRLIKRYFYLDSVTLKEEEIPAEGITINDS